MDKELSEEGQQQLIKLKRRDSAIRGEVSELEREREIVARNLDLVKRQLQMVRQQRLPAARNTDEYRIAERSVKQAEDAVAKTQRQYDALNARYAELSNARQPLIKLRTSVETWLTKNGYKIPGA